MRKVRGIIEAENMDSGKCVLVWQTEGTTHIQKEYFSHKDAMDQRVKDLLLHTQPQDAKIIYAAVKGIEYFYTKNTSITCSKKELPPF